MHGSPRSIDQKERKSRDHKTGVNKISMIFHKRRVIPMGKGEVFHGALCSVKGELWVIVCVRIRHILDSILIRTAKGELYAASLKRNDPRGRSPLSASIKLEHVANNDPWMSSYVTEMRRKQLQSVTYLCECSIGVTVIIRNTMQWTENNVA